MALTAALVVNITSQKQDGGAGVTLRAIPDTMPNGVSTSTFGDYRIPTASSNLALLGGSSTNGALWTAVVPTSNSAAATAKLYGTNASDSGVLVDPTRPVFISPAASVIFWKTSDNVSFISYYE